MGGLRPGVSGKRLKITRHGEQKWYEMAHSAWGVDRCVV